MPALSLALVVSLFSGGLPPGKQARPVPAKLIFLTQPENAGVGKPMQRAVRVAVIAADGKVATWARLSVSLSLAGGPAGATLSGALTRPAAHGIAAFDGLSLNLPGRGFVLRASAKAGGAVLSAASSRFNVFVPTSISLQTQPASIRFGDHVSVLVSVSPCQGDFGGTAGKIQIWLKREMVAAAPLSGVPAGCQSQLPIAFSGPYFYAGTYRLTVAFLSSNRNYGFSRLVYPLLVAPQAVTLAYAGKSLFRATGPGARVDLRAKISLVSPENGPGSAKDRAAGIFDRLNRGTGRGTGRVTVDFFDCSTAPCRRIGAAPVRNSSSAPGTGFAALATELPVGVFALTFRLRQTAGYFSSPDGSAGQGVVETGESAIAVTPPSGAGLRGAGWVRRAAGAGGKCWFAFDVRGDPRRALAGAVTVIYRGVFETVPADFMIRSQPPVALHFLDRKRDEAELTARAGVTILDRGTGNVIGGFAAPATANLTVIVVSGGTPQFGLRVRNADGKSFTTVGTRIGKSLLPVPLAGGGIFSPFRP